jgi:hypothetical protein
MESYHIDLYIEIEFYIEIYTPNLHWTRAVIAAAHHISADNITTVFFIKSDTGRDQLLPEKTK